jgi:hypothetical protein
LSPDAILVIGDPEATAQLEASLRAIADAYPDVSEGEIPPAVIYAGNSEAALDITEILGKDFAPILVDGALPGAEGEELQELQRILENLHRQQKMVPTDGFDTVAAWSSVPPMPAIGSVARFVQYQAQQEGINVLGIETGGAGTAAVAMVDGRLELVTRPDLALKGDAPWLLDQIPAESLANWLPFEMSPARMRNALNQELGDKAASTGATEGLFLAQAVAREAIALTLAGLHSGDRTVGSPSDIDFMAQIDLIIGGGEMLAKASTPAQAAFVLLNALQPVGVCKLALDSVGLMATLGALAVLSPEAAAQVAGQDTLWTLGPVVAPVGTAEPGQPALTCTILYQDGRAFDMEVPYGSLQVIPLGARDTVELELRPSPHFHLGSGRKGGVVTAEVDSGNLGLIVDARGRPLPQAVTPRESQARMRRWLADIGA